MPPRDSVLLFFSSPSPDCQLTLFRTFSFSLRLVAKIYASKDLVLIIEGSEFALKSCVYLWSIQSHVHYRDRRQDVVQEMEGK